MNSKPNKVFILISLGKYEEIIGTELLSRCETDPAYKDKLFIPFESGLLEVSKKDYQSFYKDIRRQKYLHEEAILHNQFSYNALDSDEMTGEETIVDLETDVQADAEKHLMAERLHKCLSLLSESEYKMIYALYFAGMSEREYMKCSGLPQKTINNRKKKILGKLKKLFEK